MTTTKVCKNVTRYDTPKAHGYMVRVFRSGVMRQRWYGDATHGSKAAALRAAKAGLVAVIEASPRRLPPSGGRPPGRKTEKKLPAVLLSVGGEEVWYRMGGQWKSAKIPA